MEIEGLQDRGRFITTYNTKAYHPNVRHTNVPMQSTTIEIQTQTLGTPPSPVLPWASALWAHLRRYHDAPCPPRFHPSDPIV